MSGHVGDSSWRSVRTDHLGPADGVVGVDVVVGEDLQLGVDVDVLILLWVLEVLLLLLFLLTTVDDEGEVQDVPVADLVVGEGSLGQLLSLRSDHK